MFPSLQESLKQVLFVVQILGVCLLGLLFISRKNESKILLLQLHLFWAWYLFIFTCWVGEKSKDNDDNNFDSSKKIIIQRVKNYSE